MSRQVFADEEIPSFTKLNAVSDQTHIICTSSTHPSSPIEGMHIYETDTLRDLFYDGSVWRSLPMGVIARDGIDQTGPSITTEVGVNGSELTFDAYEDDWYRYEVSFTITSNVAADVCPVHVEFDDGGGYDPLIPPAPGTGCSTDVGFPIEDTFPRVTLSCIMQAPSDIANASFITYVARTIGSGSVQIPSGSGTAIVEHLGAWL